ncbi:ribonuclease H-like domain-containing protein [Tanacetum coccineum]|uniref:Ribonuclease H-like domain-containing protein n=1 Tax=Tanacetum coccineum TaxID=301880 RepID=A0ABQ5FNS2_9ASTR
MSASQDEIPPPPPPPPSSSQTPTQQTPHTVSTIKLPILKKGEYDIWAMKMEHYLAHTDYPIWEVIQNGNGPVSITTDTSGQIKVLPPRTAEEIVARERERKARTTLLMALPEDHLAKFHKMTDAKEMWDAIKSRFGGNDESKKMQKYILKQQFEGFSVSNTEGLHKGYDRFQSLLSQLEIHGAGVSTEDANQKFLRSLPSAWSQVSLIMRTKPGVDSLSFDDLYNNLRVFESDIKGSTASSSSSQNVAFVSENTSSTNEVSTAYCVPNLSGQNSKYEQTSSYSLLANQSSCPQLDHEDLEQIDEYDLEEMDLKWQVAMISMRMKKFYKKTGRKLQFDAKEPVGFDKTKVECYNCHKTGHFARECRIKGTQDNRRRDAWNSGNKDGSRTGQKEDSKALVTIDGKEADREQLSDASIEIKAYSQGLKKVEAQLVAHQQGQLCTEPTELVSEPVVNESNIESQPKVWSDAPIIKEYESDSEDEFSTARANSTKNVSTARQSFNRQTLLTSTAMKVNTVKPIVNRVNTAKVNAVSTVGGKRETAVKSSTGYNWRPQRNNWHNISKYNNGSNLRNCYTFKDPLGRLKPKQAWAYLAEFQDFNGGPVAFGGSKGYITGKGKIKTGKLDFEDVCFVKELQHFNLFFVSQMCDKKNKVLFTDSECLVLSLEFKLPDENHILLKIPRQNNMYSFNLENIVPSGGLACLIAKATTDESKKWHRRLGYVNFKNLNKLVKGNLVRGLPSKIFQNNHTCVACQKGKQYKASCKAKAVSSISHSLQLLHMDLFGPTSNKELVKSIVKGIKRNTFNARTHRQNGVAERKNRTLIEAARTMLADSFLPNTFWAEAVSTACYVLNRVLVTKPHNKTPYELLTENKPNVAGKGPTWLFDLDYLTDSMNYHSVRSENQANLHASQQEANQNAGTEDIIDAGDSEKEDKSAQDCFVPPIWPSYSSTITPILQTDDKREGPGKEEQVFLDELERLKSTPAKASSTKLVNTVSIPVSTDPTNLEEDDSEIPPLEDIYQNSPNGIFTTSSYDDEGAVADFTNLETVVNVSPIPTLRIHSSHPTTLILGDPNSAVQTRSKLHKSSGAHAFVSYVQKQRRNNHKDFQHFDDTKGFVVLVDLPYGKKDYRVDFKNKFNGKEILKKFDFANVKTANTPIETQKPLVKDEEANDVDVHLYRSMIGSLMYLTASRPDIMGKPKTGSLVYPRVSSFDLESYSDSDYAGANLDRKSITGGCQFLGRRLISWQCKKQTIVATSLQRQYMFCSQAALGQVLWISKSMLDYGALKSTTDDNVADFLKRHLMLAVCIKKQVNHRCCISRGLIEFRELLSRVTNGTETLLIPTLFILCLDKVSTDSENLVPLGKVCTALESKMAVLESCPKHNMVAYLEKSEGNAEFHEIIDFLKRSYIHHALTTPSPNQAIIDAIQLMGYEKGKHFSGKVTPLFATMLVQPTQDEGVSSERPSEAQPTPSPVPTSEVPYEPQTDSSPAQTRSSGENLGGHSSSDKSLLGNEDEMTIQSVYDICLSLCKQVSDQAKEIHKRLGRSDHKAQEASYNCVKESVSNKGGKFAKGDSSVQRDPIFDEMPDEDTV